MRSQDATLSASATVGDMTSGKLPSGRKLPSVGFGTFNSFKDNSKVYESVKIAIENGYRLFDCAALYGNEKEIGQAIRESIESGIVARQDLFIMTKLWNTDHEPQDVEPACRCSLEAMGLDYFDVFMMHWPVQMDKSSRRTSTKAGGEFVFKVIHSGDRQRLAKTYAAMENLVQLGLTRDLGVSNFSTRQLVELLEDCTIPPLVNEVERHPLLQQTRLFDYCKEHKIQIIGYSPLGKIGYREKNCPDMFAIPEIQDIARETGRTPAQVVLGWAVQSGATVIPKSLTPSRIESNFNCQDNFLNQEQMNRIYALDRGYRYVRVPYYDFPDDKVDLSLKQPKSTKGLIDEKQVYRNRFHRAGKPLDSAIIIETGAIRNLAKRALEYVPEKCHEAKNYVVTDSIIDEFYGDKVMHGLQAAGLDFDKIIIPSDEVDESGNPSSERHKTLDVYSSCVDEILEKGISKNSCIISLGGGVVNNLCGFLAASLYRGISLVHITTTVMGMADAAIDFKQAVNHRLGKNLLGAYYPASNVIIDPEVLQTLSERHILNGIAEALKHALCQSREMTESIVAPLRNNLYEALRDNDYLELVCRECIDYKVPTLTHYHESDFNEMVPQYGHAIAHAVEHLSFNTQGVPPLLHGEAVSIGMCVTAEVAKQLGVCNQITVDEHYKYCSDSGLPIYIPEGLTIEMIHDKLCYDKHFVKKPTMGLIAEIGYMHCQDDGAYSIQVENNVIQAALIEHMRRRDSSTEPRMDLYSVDAGQVLSCFPGARKCSASASFTTCDESSTGSTWSW